MILFFITRRERATLTTFFETWGSRLGESVRLVYYEELARLEALPGAVSYVFTDLERLTPAGLRFTSDLADLLAGTAAEFRVVNHPRDVLRRYELLCALHERGINPFRPYRALPVPCDVRYPVFLRSEHEHRVISPLLWSQEEVERQLVRAHARGYDLAALLVVEFQDVSDEDGLFHRYIAYVIGDVFVPGHLAFGSNWVVKGGPFLEGKRLAEQRASAVSREHEPLLLEIAQRAGVGYGRYDYAVVDGQVVVWELNTNPTLLLRPEKHSPFAFAEIRPVADRLTEAFERLAGEPRHRPPVRISPRPAESLVARPWRLRKRLARVPLRLAEPLVLPSRRRAILDAATAKAAGARDS